jgi:hypothetical protein
MSIASQGLSEAAIAEVIRRSTQKPTTPGRRTIRPRRDEMLVAEAR